MTATASRWAVLSSFLGPPTKALLWPLSRFAQRSFPSLEPAERQPQLAAPRECAAIDTGYGPRVPEICSAIAWAPHQSRRWLIDTHWHFDHTDGNSASAESNDGGWPCELLGALIPRPIRSLARMERSKLAALGMARSDVQCRG